MNIQNYFNLLGLEAIDKITNFKGIISCVSFDLYGCIQVILSPPVAKDGSKKEGHWFDIHRIRTLTKTPVMQCPDFPELTDSKKQRGPAEKPIKL